MRLRLPLSKQKPGETNCGPRCLKMILDYFGEEKSLKEIEELTGFKEGKWTFTVMVAQAAKKLGYDVDFYSKSIQPTEEISNMPEWKKYSPFSVEELEKLVQEAKEAGIKMKEISLPLNKLLSFVKETSIPIVTLDWAHVINKPEKSYKGHFVLIIGYDNKFVYIQQSGPKGPWKMQAIRRDIFDKARKAKGTDEDFVVIHRKPKP